FNLLDGLAYDPEGLGAGAGLIKSGSGRPAPYGLGASAGNKEHEEQTVSFNPRAEWGFLYFYTD
ncbi:hypothetical protein D3H55_13340, partial [Bacillus salacetis]